MPDTNTHVEGYEHICQAIIARDLVGLLFEWGRIARFGYQPPGVDLTRLNLKTHASESRPPAPWWYLNLSCLIEQLPPRGRQVIWLYYAILPNRDEDEPAHLRRRPTDAEVGRLINRDRRAAAIARERAIAALDRLAQTTPALL